MKISATGQLTFDPVMQTAHVGDIIEWTNTGSVEHTITFDTEPSLSDPSLQPGATWEVKFTTAGTYHYHCSIHSGMVGTIVSAEVTSVAVEFAIRHSRHGVAREAARIAPRVSTGVRRPTTMRASQRLHIV